jgi:prepilin-type N-terminal cleavage/methylation domain-containing protein
MASTNTSSKPPARRGTGGFTLTEMMVGTAIGTMIMAAVMTTYIMSVRAFTAIGNYWDIHTDGRYAVDCFSGDMRGVSSIITFATNGPVTVKIPMFFDSNGNVTSNKTVTYSLAGGCLKRFDSSSGGTKSIATNIYNVKFSLYDRVGNATLVTNSCKAIQLELFLRKYTAGRAQTEDYLSARLDMRNLP